MTGFPYACPKCGQPIRPTTVERHFLASHPGSIGEAIFTNDPQFSYTFVYLGPVHGAVGRVWHVVWLSVPLAIGKLDLGQWTVRWPDGVEAPTG
jgi:hypothetical protein